MNNLIAKIKSTNNLKSEIQKILSPLGGIENFVKPGERVLIKPNFNTADPFPASSDPEFIKAVIETVKQVKPSEIIIGDSCTLFQRTKKVMECLNIGCLEKEYGIKVINFDQGKFVKKKINGQYLKSVRIPKIMEEVDKIIILPCLKVHRYARFTMSLKIGVGIMKKRERIKLHAKNLEEKIAELNLAYKPDLIIMDGRKAFITEGPEKGQIVEPDILMAGVDRVAMDIEGLKILKSYPAENLIKGEILDQPQIKQALEINIGSKEYELINT